MSRKVVGGRCLVPVVPEVATAGRSHQYRPRASCCKGLAVMIERMGGSEV